MLKSLPPWGKVLNEVKRMRGKCAAATRERVVLWEAWPSSVSGRGR